MRHILLHHHIFKNAGSTLDATLAAQFGHGFANLENNGDPVSEAMLFDFLEKNPTIKAVSSHHIHGASFDPILQNPRFRTFDLALVRRPMQRVLSVFKYIRRTPSELDLWKRATEMGIRDFLQLLIDKHPYEIDNPQVNTFANAGFYGHAVGEDDLARAWDRYRNFSLCAPVERYDEAMVVLEYFNSPVYLPAGLNLAYRKVNVSEPLPGEADVAELLGRNLYEWLTRLQMFDEQLWKLANAELDRRVQLVPQFSNRLAAFRARCQHLQALD